MIANNTWYFVAAVADVPNKMKVLYVYNTAGTLLANVSINWTEATFGSDAGIASIGGETATSAEYGNGYAFPGNIDEVRVYAAALFGAQLDTVRQITRVCAAAVDHYELSLASASLACLPTTVTVTACSDNTSPCSNKATTLSGTTAALSTSAGSLAASLITFNASGTASTTLSIPLAADGAGVSVTLSGEQTAATNPRQCCPNGVNCVAGNSCATTFNTAGFLFSGGAGGAEATVANQTASVAFGPYWLRAVKTNTATQACEAALSSPQPVTFNYQCVDPAACSAGNRLSVGASAVASSGTSLNLAFDANGNASLGNLSFSDVGKISVNASATVAGATLSGSMKGAAGTNFVVKPFDFLVVPCNTGTPCVAAPADPGIAGGGAVFATAGLTFGATITARASGGAVTPNFGAGTTNGVESVLLSQTLKGPAAGNAGALGGTSLIPRSSFVGGVASVNDLTWSEVGVITLTGTNNTFIGNALSTTGTSGNIGRFVPDHFDTVVTQGCSAGAYTYSGQAFTLQISAMTGAGTPALAQNYTGATGFAKAHTLTEPNAVAGSFGATAALPASAFASGVATISTPVFTFTSATRQTTPSLIKVRTTDADAVSSLRAVAASSVEGTSTVRGGRVRILNAYGSEKLDLPMTLRAQYWNGTGWVQNTEDNCTGDTTLGAANAVSLALAGAAATCVQDTGNPGRSGAGCVAAGPLAPTNEQFRSGTSMVVGPSTLLKGDFNLWLQKTGVTAAAPQWTTVTVSVPSWLQYPWTGVVNSNPAGRATFGVYKSPLIYRRENY